MPVDKDGNQTEILACSNNGTRPYYIYSGNKFITELLPKSTFFYHVDDNLDLRASLQAPAAEELTRSKNEGYPSSDHTAESLEKKNTPEKVAG